MASRRNRPGPRWTPTNPVPATSVALPPSATAPGAGASEPAPSLEAFVRGEHAAEPSPVEAALAQAGQASANPRPDETAPHEEAAEHPEAPAAAADAHQADEVSPSTPETPPASVGEQASTTPPVAPVGVGFPRRGESVRPGAATPLAEINATLVSFARTEGEAALAHLGALSKASSPADALRLQLGEFQRVADSSLSCFGSLLRAAARLSGSPPR